jgi:hypothetical protein
MSEFTLNPDPSMTTLAVAQANTLAGSQQIASKMNEQLKTGYLAGYSNWALQVQVGRPDGTAPPHPPLEQIVVTGPDGWPYFTQGTKFVCDMPPLPSEALRTKGVIHVGPRVGDGIYIVGPDDTAAEGTHATAPDGTALVRTAVFCGSYYLKS